MRYQSAEFFRPDIEVHKVKRIDFGILRPEEVEKMAVVKIEERLVYGPNGEPKSKGTSTV